MMLICCRFADCDRLRSRCCAWCETPTAQGLCKIIFSVLIWPSCAKAPVSQLVEETASKSVQCGFESHRGHRIDEQPWLEISSRGFLFETHLAHVPLRGGSVPSIHQAIRVTRTKRGVLDFLNRIFSRLTVLSWLDDSGVFLVADECKRVNGNRKSKRVAQFKNNE